MVAGTEVTWCKTNRKESKIVESYIQTCDKKSMILFYMIIIAVINVYLTFLELSLSLETSIVANDSKYN